MIYVCIDNAMYILFSYTVELRLVLIHFNCDKDGTKASDQYHNTQYRI